MTIIGDDDSVALELFSLIVSSILVMLATCTLMGFHLLQLHFCHFFMMSILIRLTTQLMVLEMLLDRKVIFDTAP